jgi:microsomal triglyceride transfer protein large subunit
VELSITQQPQISLQSKIDFSSKTALCMLLSQPDGEMRQTIKKSVDIAESKKPKALRNELNLRYKVSGKTFVLNQKNNDMCNSLMNE